MTPTPRSLPEQPLGQAAALRTRPRIESGIGRNTLAGERQRQDMSSHPACERAERTPYGVRVRAAIHHAGLQAPILEQQ